MSEESRRQQLVDLEMNKPPEIDDGRGGPEDDSGGGAGKWIALVVLLLAIGGAAWYFLGRSTPPPPAVTEAPPPSRPAPAPVEPEAVEPEEEEESTIDLPPLNASDELIRELAVQVSSHPQLGRWLVNEDLASRFVAAVDNVADGKLPRAHVGFLAPEGSFQVMESGGEILVDPKSYERYDLLTAVFVSLDTEASAKLYRDLRPLFQEAYQNLGYPDRDFDDTLAKAVNKLLNTPEVEGPVALREETQRYELAEARLEGLEPAQKALLRTGPENARRIKAKLRQLAAALAL